ncbi:uncharacterized protein LOC108161848 [Drosophila miranda]|uniref:uncharacterized protein LOC108161848 n=1 Tax=Drosophila miranda TaxID=7229 RepID=UPI00143FB455|nr:uncharacterized protein LOC108161848 [Drosophila miranda]
MRRIVFQLRSSAPIQNSTMARVSIKTEGVLQRCPKQVVDQGQWLLNLYVKLPMLLMHSNGVAGAVSGVAEYLANVELKLLCGVEESQATAITIESETTTPTPSSKVFACLYSTLNERWAVASRRRTFIPYALPQTESYPISPRQTESYPNITEAYSRQTESYPSQTESYLSRTEAHPLQDSHLTSHRHPSTWPSTPRTLTMATKEGATRSTRC